jgi:hypothetical protein
VWWGGHSFGPRIAADLAVPFALLAAVLLVHWPSSTTRSWTKGAATAALAWSVLVQALGAFSYPAGDWNGLPLNVDLTHDRLWDWRDSQLSRTLSSGTYRQYQASLPNEPDADEDGSPTMTDLDY